MANTISSIRVENLDRLAATFAQNIVRCAKSAKEAGDLDNLVTKTLGVLQENGVYAAILFLASQRQDKQREQAQRVMDEILNLLDDMNTKFTFKWSSKPDPTVSEEVLRYISSQVVVNLERLLLAKETLEQMLIYTRYGAKARKAEGDDR
ncbi:MAG: hypothetical protein FJ134_01400 [Deltaproteobacteria bacterium]|nr:hypothetical protein [Deltaproteobacteria bacterium]